MTYNEIIEVTKHGKVALLPNFIGYFKWDYGSNTLKFYNKEFKCNAEDLNILNRDDFYYII